MSLFYENKTWTVIFENIKRKFLIAYDWRKATNYEDNNAIFCIKTETNNTHFLERLDTGSTWIEPKL